MACNHFLAGRGFSSVHKFWCRRWTFKEHHLQPNLGFRLQNCVFTVDGFSLISGLRFLCVPRRWIQSLIRFYKNVVYTRESSIHFWLAESFGCQHFLLTAYFSWHPLLASSSFQRADTFGWQSLLAGIFFWMIVQKLYKLKIAAIMLVSSKIGVLIFLSTFLKVNVLWICWLLLVTQPSPFSTQNFKYFISIKYFDTAMTEAELKVWFRKSVTHKN